MSLNSVYNISFDIGKFAVLDKLALETFKQRNVFEDPSLDQNQQIINQIQERIPGDTDQRGPAQRKMKKKERTPMELYMESCILIAMEKTEEEVKCYRIYNQL